MWIPPKEYYEELFKETQETQRMVCYYARQAERMKRICQYTKGKGGLYRLIHELAYNNNKKYCDLGVQIGLKQFGILGYEMDNLIEHLKSIKSLEDKGS